MSLVFFYPFLYHSPGFTNNDRRIGKRTPKTSMLPQMDKFVAVEHTINEGPKMNLKDTSVLCKGGSEGSHQHPTES